MKDRTGQVWMVADGGWVILIVGPPKPAADGAPLHPALMLDAGCSKGRTGMVFDYQDRPPLEESGRVRLL